MSKRTYTERLKTAKRRCKDKSSLYVRLRDCFLTTGTFEQGKCFTCDKILNNYTRECHSGHFINEGSNPAGRYMVQNQRMQCKRCNYYLSGNKQIYTIRLIDQIGRDAVDELMRESRAAHKWNLTELEQVENILDGLIERFKIDPENNIIL